MQITKKQLKDIISEEVENISNEKDEFETLLENYSDAYSDSSDSEFVSKEALIDFLEVLEEAQVPRIAFEAFMSNLPEESVVKILKETLEERADSLVSKLNTEGHDVCECGGNMVEGECDECGGKYEEMDSMSSRESFCIGSLFLPKKGMASRCRGP